MTMRKVLIVLLFLSYFSLFAQQSYNMSLLGKYTYDFEGYGVNDIWGYVDPVSYTHLTLPTIMPV